MPDRRWGRCRADRVGRGGRAGGRPRWHGCRRSGCRPRREGPAARRADGVGAGIGIERAGVDEWIEQCGGEPPLLGQVAADLGRVLRRGGRQPQRRAGPWAHRQGRDRGAVPFQPLQGLAEAQALQVHHQVDGAASPAAEVPVHELGASDREHATGGCHRARAAQHDGHGNDPHPVGSQAPSHGSAESLPRKVTDCGRIRTESSWLNA